MSTPVAICALGPVLTLLTSFCDSINILHFLLVSKRWYWRHGGLRVLISKALHLKDYDMVKRSCQHVCLLRDLCYSFQRINHVDDFDECLENIVNRELLSRCPSDSFVAGGKSYCD